MSSSESVGLFKIQKVLALQLMKDESQIVSSLFDSIPIGKAQENDVHHRVTSESMLKVGCYKILSGNSSRGNNIASDQRPLISP